MSQELINQLNKTFTPPPWLNIAFGYNGLTEVKGPKHNQEILKMLDGLKAWWREDESAWCATFVSHCLKEAGMTYPKMFMRALAFDGWGKVLQKPCYGCIAFTKRKGGGHVFFVVGETKDGRIVGYGGNQNDQVNFRLFDRNKIVGYRYPIFETPSDMTLAYAPEYGLPVLDAKLETVSSMA